MRTTYMIATSPVPIVKDFMMYGRRGPRVAPSIPAQRKENAAARTLSFGIDGLACAGACESDGPEPADWFLAVRSLLLVGAGTGRDMVTNSVSVDIFAQSIRYWHE
jgi:hypothetical protein